MMLVSEGKIIINQDETVEANHASIAPNQTKCSMSLSILNTTFLRFGSLAPIAVDVPRKTLEGSLEIDNHKESEVDYGLRLLVRSGDIKQFSGYDFLKQKQQGMM